MMRDINLWQSPVWGEFQKSLGRKVFHFEHTLSGEVIGCAQVVEHRLPFGLAYWYIPRGPLFASDELMREASQPLWEKILAAAARRHVIFVKCDSAVPLDFPDGFRVVPSTSVQPDTTLMIDLKQEEHEIRAHMKQKGRYNIGLAEKKGVEIKMYSGEAAGKMMADFFELLQQTTRRDRFRGHGLEFYRGMMKVLGDHATLIMAYLSGTPVAGGIFTFCGSHAVYYYGVSSDAHREAMAPYLVQWTAIREAKKRGCEYYDFLGIAPQDASNHPWQGVTEFKKKFGGFEVAYPQARDIVLRPLWYRIMLIAKSLS